MSGDVSSLTESGQESVCQVGLTTTLFEYIAAWLFDFVF